MINIAESYSPMVRTISELGWLHLRALSSNADLINKVMNIAYAFGKPCAGRNGRVLERLAPMLPSQAKPNSLSATNGIAAFPLHTDGAHKSEPPHFVILACECPGYPTVPTVLECFDGLDLSPSDRHRCETAPFLIRNGRRSFYSTISDRSQPFLRFDQGCMTALTDAASDVARVIAACTVNLTVVEWAAGDILIIDNWRVLHGRGLATSAASPDRRLMRVSVQ
jgi:hypothetical protein